LASASADPDGVRTADWLIVPVVAIVAVGGTFPGNPDATTRFPREMTIDDVRVSP
jgi:hypothetical protein